jgi:hypothetical protein
LGDRPARRMAIGGDSDSLASLGSAWHRLVSTCTVSTCTVSTCALVTCAMRSMGTGTLLTSRQAHRRRTSVFALRIVDLPGGIYEMNHGRMLVRSIN